MKRKSYDEMVRIRTDCKNKIKELKKEIEKNRHTISMVNLAIRICKEK